MSKKTIEQIKTAAIIVLALIVVFGGSYYASELKNCDPNGTGGTTESTDTNDTAYTSDIPESEQADLTSIDIDDYLALKAGSDKGSSRCRSSPEAPRTLPPRPSWRPAGNPPPQTPPGKPCGCGAHSSDGNSGTMSHPPPHGRNP